MKSRRSCAYARTVFGDFSIAIKCARTVDAVDNFAVTDKGRGLHTRRHQHALHSNFAHDRKSPQPLIISLRVMPDRKPTAGGSRSTSQIGSRQRGSAALPHTHAAF